MTNVLHRGIAVLLASAMFHVASAPGALESAKPSDGPPSSLKPGTPRGKVRFSHNHRKILSCYPHEKKSGTVRCRSRRDNAPSGASVTLRPIEHDAVLDKDRRAPVTLSFANDLGRQEKLVEIAAGDWEVQWGPRPHKRFRVNDGEKFKVWFRSVTGRCELDAKKRECTLRAYERSRRVVVEDGHAIP